jgi:Gpi18-like mannosyltransferase
MMEALKKDRVKIASFFLIIVSVVIRICVLPRPNGDMTNFNLIWYQALVDNGIAKTLATSFTNYSPPYTYLLALATLSKDIVPPLIALKLIAILFDILGMYIIYRIVKIKYTTGSIPQLAAAVYFSMPTVIINSSLWGQADSIYTCFLLLCLYFVLTERSALSMAAFGLAFAVKAQALFLAPFLLIMILRNKISWKSVSIPPLVHVIAILPVVFLGRGFMEALLVYLNQAGSYKILSANAPNFYVIFPKESYHTVMPIGLLIAAIAILFWVYWSSYRAKPELTKGNILLLATISVSLMPFLLPKMHDRYFYPADVFSLLLAFFIPELWFLPILYQMISAAATSVFLFNGSDALLLGAALLNAVAIAYLLKYQREHALPVQNKWTSWATALFPWIFTVLTPLVLLGAGINLMTSQAFYRVENKLFYPSDSTALLNPQQRLFQFDRILYYMNNPVQTEYLYAKNQVADGKSFDKHEAYYLQDVRSYWQPVLKIQDLSFLALYVTGLLAWAGGISAALRRGINMGGWLTALLGIFAAAFSFQIPFTAFNDLPTLNALFPPSLLIGALIFLLAFVTASGLILGIMLSSKEIHENH